MFHIYETRLRDKISIAPPILSVNARLSGSSLLESALEPDLKDLKEKDMSDVPWNNYMRRKKKLMPTDEQTQMVESRISLSEDPFVNTSFANMDYSMSIHHPEQVRKALVSIGLEPWQHHAMAQKKRSSKEEMVLTRSGFLSNSFVESRTGLGGDSYWHYD